MPLAFDWTQLAQQTVIGLASGGIWATLAIALVLIYRSTGVVNFAQGEMAMFSTFIAWQLIQWGFPYWLAFGATIVISFAAGVLIDAFIVRATLVPALMKLAGAANWWAPAWARRLRRSSCPSTTSRKRRRRSSRQSPRARRAGDVSS